MNRRRTKNGPTVLVWVFEISCHFDSVFGRIFAFGEKNFLPPLFSSERGGQRQTCFCRWRLRVHFIFIGFRRRIREKYSEKEEAEKMPKLWKCPGEGGANWMESSGIRRGGSGGWLNGRGWVWKLEGKLKCSLLSSPPLLSLFSSRF